MKRISTAVATLILGLVALVVPVKASTTNIQGRWEFVTITGDSPNQISQSGQSTISTYLLQSGSTISNVPAMTTDAFAADLFSYNNGVFTGSVSQNNINLTYTVTNPDGSKFHYVYTGTYKAADSDNPTRITGTYTSDSWSSTGSGTFVATYFPNFTGQTYQGTIDAPDMGSGPTAVSLSLTLTAQADHSLNITNVSLGQPLAACFTPPFHVAHDPNYPLTPTNASGVGYSIYLVDSVGGQLWLNGLDVQKDGFTPAAIDEVYDPSTPLPTNPTNLGTNNLIELWYGITTNNACNGLGGGDTPFQPVPSKHKHDKERKQHGGRR